MDVNFSGESKDFHHVMGRKTERLTNGTIYDEFKDLVISYTTENFKFGEEISVLIRDLVDPEARLKTDHQPTKPDKKNKEGVKDDKGEYDHFEMETWKQENKNYLDRKALMKSNCKKLYAFVWGQCTQTLQTEVKAIKEFKKKNENSESLWLLEKINLAGNTNISIIDPEETPASTEGNSKMTTSGIVRKGVTFSLKTILKNNKKMRSTKHTYTTALRGSD